MNAISRCLPLAAVALLAACATATPYQPLTRGVGYAEQKIESNRYRVRFAGNSQTPRETVENYLLYRAAELTLASGFDYFVTAKQDTEVSTEYQQTFSAFGGFGRYYWYPSPSIGVGSSYPITEYEARADIVMFSGAKAQDNTNAFNAKEVIDNLGAQIQRPEPEST